VAGRIELSWSAKQYVAFEDERTRPVRDLLAALPPIDARSVIDLGCGPGNSTEVLAQRYPSARVGGIDSSPDMIAAARRRLPQADFAVEDVRTWSSAGLNAAGLNAAGLSAAGANTAGPFDVILANAVLQWVPGHATLLPELIGKLAPQGGLAVQMPDNLEEPAHRLMRQIAREGPWAAKLADAAAARTPLASMDWYYDLLQPLCTRVDFWRTTYYHVLAGGATAVVEWFKGSGLRPFVEPLDDAERSAYLERYTAAIAGAYPAAADGTVLLPFPRMFMLAIR
jgi:trans-aconitate 2-methyltransferase